MPGRGKQKPPAWASSKSGPAAKERWLFADQKEGYSSPDETQEGAAETMSTATATAGGEDELRRRKEPAAAEPDLIDLTGGQGLGLTKEARPAPPGRLRARADRQGGQDNKTSRGARARSRRCSRTLPTATGLWHGCQWQCLRASNWWARGHAVAVTGRGAAAPA